MEGNDALQSDDTFQSELELETLFSIYVRELEVNRNKDGDTAVSIQLHPATADKLDEQFVRMTLAFTLPKEYPDVTPEICIQNTRGLSDEKIEEITLHLEEEAEERKGSPMLFELIELAKEHLTADNKPNEECAICLYGFLDGDAFMKTECYHYFHSHCLSRYVESRFSNKEDKKDKKKDKKKDSKLVNKEENSLQTVPCPICRLEIHFSEFGQSFPEPIAVLEASSTVDIQPYKEVKKFEELYQKQLAQGGIIDLKAEDEKFLLEISSISDDVPTPAKSSEPNYVAESEVSKQKSCAMSEVKTRNSSNSKTSPRKFRYLKSRPKPNEKNVEMHRWKDSCAAGEDTETSLQQQSMKSDDKKSNSPSTRKLNCDFAYKSESEAAINVEDSEDSLVDKFKANSCLEDEVQDDASNSNTVKDDYFSSKAETNNKSNYYNKYNPRRTYDKPFINRFQARPNNGNMNMSRENNYRKYNSSRGSYNSVRNNVQSSSSNHVQDDYTRGRDERNDSSFRAYQNNASNRTYNYKKERNNGPFPNEKLQGRNENYTNTRSDGQYRNNFRERNNYNSSNSSNYARGFQNEKQKYIFPNTPNTYRQYPQPKRIPNRPYNQNNYYANNEPKRHYNGESKNVRHETDYPSRFNSENPRNFPHYNKYSRKFQSDHFEHSNRNSSRFDYSNKEDNNVQSDLKAEESNKREYPKMGRSSSNHNNKKFTECEKQGDDDDIYFEKSLNDFPPSVEKEISPCSRSPPQDFSNEKHSVKVDFHPEDYPNSPSVLSSVSGSSIPSLPPGFANPSKKVIYGLPSFHVSPPPGFQLS